MPVNTLMVAILPLDLPCSGFVTHSREILTTGKPHKKKLGSVKYIHNNNNNNNNNVKTKVIPVIIGATGTISKTCRKYVSNIPGNHEVKELQKTAILGTAHILRKVLM